MSPAQPDLLAPFDRIVVATGAQYRFGLGPIATPCSIGAPAAGPGVPAVFDPGVSRLVLLPGAARNAERFTRLAKPGQIVIAIGDAVEAGKSKQAIASAFEAALLG